MDAYNKSTKRDFSRIDLVESCFGMTRVEAKLHISDYEREFDEFCMLPENEEWIKHRIEEYEALKCFFGKAQNYLSYKNPGLPARDNYEKSLLEELREKVM